MSAASEMSIPRSRSAVLAAACAEMEPAELAAFLIQSLPPEAVNVVNRKLSFFCLTVAAAETDAAAAKAGRQ